MEIKFGRGVAEKELAEAARPVLVITDAESRKVAESVPGVVSAVVARGVGLAELEEVAAKAAGAATVAAVGGETALAGGRYAAHKSGASLSLIPVVIPGEVVARPLAWTRDGGIRKEFGEHEADILVVDYGLVYQGDEVLTRAAVGDVLSILTAVEDMRQGAPSDLDEGRAEKATELVHELMDWADDLYDLTEGGIRRLVELLHARENLAREFGSRRLVEGSESAFVACARAELGREFPSGPLKCLAVIVMAEHQGLNAKPIKQFLHWIGVPWRAEQMGISMGELARVLGSLPGFSREHDFPRSALDVKEMSGEQIRSVINRSQAALIKSSLQTRDD